jgi:outer membrane protein OmpA-like peptidoglycan-associated protein
VDVYEYDDEGGGRSPVRVIAALVVIAAIAAAGWFLVRPRLSDDDSAQSPASPIPTTTSSTSGSTAVGERTSSERTSTTGEAATTATTATTADAVETTTTDAVDTTTTAADDTTTTAAVETTTAATAAETTTTTATTAPPTTPPTAAGETAPYPTLPDGNPEPAIVTFDVGRVILTGALTDQAMVDRLAELGLAYSRDPANTVVDNRLTVNPAVPRNVGVRVIELTSTRFPEGSAEILLPHAAELNRVVTAMTAFPNVSVLIIGHADQRGSDLANYALSEARAGSVYNYLVSQGIAPARLSSRAVGEADLLSINDDAASLALNRRTEFIFYGLLNP